jgi:hypothetical protein
VAECPPHEREVFSKENAMKALWLAMLLTVVGVGVVGCEADGEIDADDGELKVDVDD